MLRKPDKSPSVKPTAVVGVGASAGGLEAFTTLLRTLPSNSGLAFVLIQHLDPTHESLMVDILARRTEMPVSQAVDGQKLEANTVYIISPNSYLTTKSGVLNVKSPDGPRGARMSIDEFFISLASDQQERAIGVVLTGTGSDGTIGLKAIKSNGGLSIAQDPTTAAHDGMPRSAIQSGVVDLTLPIAEMPEAILRFATHPYITGNGDGQPERPAIKDGIGEILNLVRVHCGTDFRAYKRNTVERRIQRRMGLNLVHDPAEYLAFLRQNTAEIERLERDMMIGVTSFFRDPEIFRFVDDKVIKPLVAEAEGAVRIWVAGCSTGEEAYTLAMLLSEQRARQNKSVELQIFASDVDKDSLEHARTAIYAGSVVTSVPDALRDRYFYRLEDDRYQIQSELRDSIVFAHHNVISDPPFSKIDLISCRNLLIYLEPDVQQRILGLFHFALNNRGYLLLGNSESVSQEPNLYESLGKRERVYRKLASDLRPPRPDLTLPGREDGARGRTGFGPSRRAGLRLADLATRAIISAYGPPTVVVNRQYEVAFTSGDVDDYVKVPPGEANQYLLDMVREGLKTRLRTALHQAKRDGKVVEVSGARVKRDGRYRKVNVRVQPLDPIEGIDGMFMVAFTPVSAPGGDLPEPDETLAAEDQTTAVEISNLEDELSRTREDLQTTIEELETSNEELRASNEEGMSVNEELQSTNEELETSKEELQSLNEELSTVNSQLQDKVAELQEANLDITNLLHSTDIATLFLDRDLRIRRYTPATTSLFNLISTDIGRPLTDIAQNFRDPTLIDEAERVAVSREPGPDSQVTTVDGQLFVRRITPYETDKDSSGGVVMTFTNVTASMRAQALATERLAQIQSILEHSPVGLGLFSADGKLLHLNAVMANVSDEPIDALVGQRPSEFMGEAGAIVEKHLQEVQEFRKRLVNTSITGSTPSSPRVTRRWAASYHPLIDDAGEITSISMAIRETTHDALVTQINDASRAFNLALDSDATKCEVIETSLEAFAEHVGADVAEYWQPNQGLLECENFIAPGLSGTDEQVKKMFDDIRLAAGEGLAGDVWLNGVLRWWHTGDDSVDFVRRERAERIGLKTAVGAPVASHGDSLGVITFFFSQCLTANKSVRQALQSFADELAQHLMRVRVQDELRVSGLRKEQFLSLLGHELRNPVSVISNTVELLRGDAETPRKEVRVLQEHVQLIGRLLDDLLDFDRISRGTMELRKEPTDVVRVIRSTVENMRPQFTNKDVNLEFESARESLVQRVDAMRIAQVFSNLLTNALKFTDPNGKVIVSLETDDERLTVRVEDTGVGIAQADLTRIFDPFEQAEHRGKSNLGLGIGLALVRQLLERHDGKVTAFSKGPGQGSTFVVRLPIDEEQIVELEDKAEVPNAAPSTRRQVLLVDDNEHSVDALAVLITTWGFNVTTTYTVREALDWLKDNEPDMMVVDIALPDGTGYDVVNALESENTCVVALSGYNAGQMPSGKAMERIERHFTKPLKFDAFRQFVSARMATDEPSQD